MFYPCINKVKSINQSINQSINKTTENHILLHHPSLGLLPSPCFKRSLSNDDGNDNENVTRKYIFILFWLLRDYLNTLNFYESVELSRNQIGRSCVKVKKENENFTVVRLRSPQNLKCGHFTLLFCRGQPRNVPKCKTHVQSDCFLSLNLLFCGVVVAFAVVVAQAP